MIKSTALSLSRSYHKNFPFVTRNFTADTYNIYCRHMSLHGNENGRISIRSIIKNLRTACLSTAFNIILSSFSFLLFYSARRFLGFSVSQHTVHSKANGPLTHSIHLQINCCTNSKITWCSYKQTICFLAGKVRIIHGKLGGCRWFGRQSASSTVSTWLSERWWRAWRVDHFKSVLSLCDWNEFVLVVQLVKRFNV